MVLRFAVSPKGSIYLLLLATALLAVGNVVAVWGPGRRSTNIITPEKYEPCDNGDCNRFRVLLFGTGRSGTDDAVSSLVDKPPVVTVAHDPPVASQDPARATFVVYEPMHSLKTGYAQALNCLLHCNCSKSSYQPTLIRSADQRGDSFNALVHTWFGKTPWGAHEAYDKVCKGHYNLIIKTISKRVPLAILDSGAPVQDWAYGAIVRDPRSIWTSKLTTAYIPTHTPNELVPVVCDSIRNILLAYTHLAKHSDAGVRTHLHNFEYTVQNPLSEVRALWQDLTGGPASAAAEEEVQKAAAHLAKMILNHGGPQSLPSCLNPKWIEWHTKVKTGLLALSSWSTHCDDVFSALGYPTGAQMVTDDFAQLCTQVGSSVAKQFLDGSQLTTGHTIPVMTSPLKNTYPILKQNAEIVHSHR